MGRNQISEIPPEVGQLTNLTVLSLGENQISEIPTEIGQLTNLTVLRLGRNQIKVIPSGIGQLTSLTNLGLGRNQIEVIPSELYQLTNLRFIHLESNFIESVPTEIGNLINLTSLNLSQNKLRNLPAEVNQLSKLQSLNLYHNRFQKFPVEVTELSNLRQLHLDDNQIRSLPVTIKNLIKLEQLWLGGNSLRQLPIELGQLTSLTELHLGRNIIYQVPSELGNLKKLVSLNLNLNRLTEIPPQILGLRQLETLNLEGNGRRNIVTDFGKLLTYREQIEQAEVAQEQAEKANQFKGQFLSQMSHEIRTPMNGVIGSLDLIDEEELDSEKREHLKRAKNSGQHLLTVINEILQFYELEEGKITYYQQSFDLINTCHQVIEIVLPLSQQKNIELNLDYSPVISGGWLGDQQKIKQVLLNLLGNAIKFTSEGEVNLKLRQISQGIRIEVTDTGIGIPKDQIENIFESFTQASQGNSRKFSGTGLGLSISQRFVQGMGGKIGVESQRGKGSTFWFELPLERSELQPDPEVNKVELNNFSGRKALVVDDDIVNRVIAKSYLENLGLEVDQAVDGKDCITKFKEQKYDLIIMDLQMPELDGFEATEQIRQREKELGQNPVPILAFSASILGTVWERCQSVGMDGYVGKPFRSEELKQKLQELMFS